MKPIERVEKTLQGEAADRPPFCLYPHYDLDLLSGEILTQAVQTFVDRFEPDVVVVPACFGYTMPTKLSLDRTSDLAHLEVVHGRHGDWSQQQDAIRATCRSFFGKRPVVAVVPSAFRQLQRLAGLRLSQEALNEGGGFLMQALESLNKSLIAFIKMAVEAGLSGVLIEESAASHELMAPAVYREKLLPLLKSQILAAKPAWAAVQFLGRRIFWEDLKLDGECEGIGWPVAAGPNLARGAMRWKGFVWGGLDPTPWADASSAWLRGSLLQVLNSEMTPRPCILAPHCGLTGLRLDQIEALANALRRLPSLERLRETPAQLDERRAARPARPDKRREEREPVAPPLLSPPKPPIGARTRLHAKPTPEEPLLPPEPEQ